MVQYNKARATKPDDLRSTSEHVAEGENTVLKAVL